MLCACGQQFRDWSAAYRLFEQERFNTRTLFGGVLSGALGMIPKGAPLVAAIDDTLVHKRGRHIAGTSWRRDPLGPKFADNFIWASRFLQLSLALPEKASGPSPARMIPVDLMHCPSPRKPGKKGSAEQWKQWREASRKAAISSAGGARMAALRTALDERGMAQRQLIVTADGTFTCRAVLKGLPPRTALIGRIRKDACLYALPHEENPGRGRRRAYGRRLPTPEEIRQDQSIPWKRVKAHAAGKNHTFHLKEIPACRWKTAGGSRTLRLIVIRPLAHRLRKGGRLDYRAPAYLIATDLEMPLAQLLQAYIWRWEIEVNFRDEKTLVGMGEAQVRTQKSVETLAPFVAASYAMLLLAQAKCGASKISPPPAKWQKPKKGKHHRTSTAQTVSQLRAEVWEGSIGTGNKRPFTQQTHAKQSLPKIENTLTSAVCYASR